MEFVRRRKRGQDKKVRRTWFSEEGYRIIWRKEVHGVCVPARFQACVRTLIPYSDGELRQMWDFVNHKRRLIKTLTAARKSARDIKGYGRKRARPEASGPCESCSAASCPRACPCGRGRKWTAGCMPS